MQAVPVFCDIEPVSWCLDPDSVRRNLTPRTKAIIVVDLYGNMPQMQELLAIADQHGLPLIEDAAEALGSKYQGQTAGQFGIGSIFSFHHTKTLTTGEGGMLLLDDEQLFKRCSVLHDQGRGPDSPMYVNDEVAYKYMPFNVQAALGYAQFQRVDELIVRKRWIYHTYHQKMADVPDISLNPEPPDVINGAWITALVLGETYRLTKQELIEQLAAVGVPSRPFFYPLSSLPAYPGADVVYREKNRVAYDISSRGINLPCVLNLTEEQIDFICRGLRTVLLSPSNSKDTNGAAALWTSLPKQSAAFVTREY